MKIRTLTPRKGGTIPHLPAMRSGLPVDVSSITGRGWRIYRRGPTVLFESPPNDKGERDVYERHVEDFDLNWQLDAGDDISNMTRWDSHPAEAKKDKK
jgi:hypothetical protein